MDADIAISCKKLPKLELHAHLNGSISEKTLFEIWENSEIYEHSQCDIRDVINDTKERSLAQCFQLFKIIHSLTVNPDIIKRITRDVIQDFANDGVVYLELRSTPRKIEGKMSKEEYINAVIESIKTSLKQHPIIVKLLISIDRKSGRAEAEENLQLAIEAKKENPEIVAGIDFSGMPGIGDIDDFLPVLEKAHSCGFPLSVHCAEIPDETETEKIFQICPERLGHGTCIHPDAGGSDKLWKTLLESHIPIELCLTSNIKTGTVIDYKNHHFDYLQKHGHPIVLGTDDKGVFSTSLSEEYCIAAKTFGLNIEQLWQLSYDSISYAFANKLEKRKLTQILMEWKQNMMKNKTDKGC